MQSAKMMQISCKFIAILDTTSLINLFACNFQLSVLNSHH